MRYYDCGGYPLCSREVLALPALHALPEAGEVLFGFHRTPGAGRDTFPVTAPSLLTAEEAARAGGSCSPYIPPISPSASVTLTKVRCRPLRLPIWWNSWPEASALLFRPSTRALWSSAVIRWWM